MNQGPNRFAHWLSATMQSRGLTQAELARAVGVADTQVSRWRRGQVVPTVHYLQKLAESLGVPRSGLDVLAGYPVETEPSPELPEDPTRAAELAAYQTRFAELLEERLPQTAWRGYVEACESLAGALAASLEQAEAAAPAEGEHRAPPSEADEGKRNIGFRP